MLRHSARVMVPPLIFHWTLLLLLLLLCLASVRSVPAQGRQPQLPPCMSCPPYASRRIPTCRSHLRRAMQAERNNAEKIKHRLCYLLAAEGCSRTNSWRRQAMEIMQSFITAFWPKALFQEHWTHAAESIARPANNETPQETICSLCLVRSPAPHSILGPRKMTRRWSWLSSV